MFAQFVGSSIASYVCTLRYHIDGEEESICRSKLLAERWQAFQGVLDFEKVLSYCRRQDADEEIAAKANLVTELDLAKQELALVYGTP